ncbi:uncharacterized protein LOC105687306 [Athalia rosae]|uniref:uncharacterized protein LOC105687306 n=1 Tax=Athalia rosae TaxID=37344 RepID=UPI00203454B7|nr:uncharacterized protein LOC105687306 [Athalia rosae]
MFASPSYSFCRALILLIISLRARCNRIGVNEEAIARLDEMLAKNFNADTYLRKAIDESQKWQEYKFGTGVGNREELIVTDITIFEDESIAEKSRVIKWKFSPGSQYGIMAGLIDESTIVVRLHRNRDGIVINDFFLTVVGTIVDFKIASLTMPDLREVIVAILCVEVGPETKLLWYFNSENKLELKWTTQVIRNVEKLELFQRNYQNKLLILNEPFKYNRESYSAVEVYEFEFLDDTFDIWLCQRMWLPVVSSLQICSIRESTFLNVRTEDKILFYEFVEKEANQGLFKLSQTIPSNGSKSSTCFENGYSEYLIISGQQPALYYFDDNEFLYDARTAKLFNDLQFGQTIWAECLPVDTYREECLLVIQLKNLTIVGLAWQGEIFKVVNFPPTNIGDFRLSNITPLPKYGFLCDNKIVRLRTELRDLEHPEYLEFKKITELKNLLEETFLKQKIVLRETERKIENSYLKNPAITGTWNISDVVAKSAKIRPEVSVNSVTVGSKLFTTADQLANLTVLEEELEKFDDKIATIRLILRNALRVDSEEVHLKNGILLDGGIEVLGTLYVNNLTLDSLNGFSVADISNDFVKRDETALVKGLKSFPSVEADRVNVVKINGVPKEEIVFNTENVNYEYPDFENLNHLVVNGSLHFTSINGFDWKDLTEVIVWKNSPKEIPGTTVVRGEIIADSIYTPMLNGLKYPDDYVQQNGKSRAEITGMKTFADLKVTNLKGIRRINGIPFEDFVTLNSEQNLTNKITFENLRVEENLRIDGRIIGIKEEPEKKRLTLSDTNTITEDTMFDNLYVNGKLFVENSLNGKTKADFDAIVLKSDKTAVITGHKTFLGNVAIDRHVIVMSKKFNGHPIDEIATLDGEQIFPHLEKISTPVTFGEISYKQYRDLENYFGQMLTDGEYAECSMKKLVFGVPPLLESIRFDTLNDYLTLSEFNARYSNVLKFVSYENLEAKVVYAGTVNPDHVNGVLFSDFDDRRVSISRPQVLWGNYTVKKLKSRVLKTEYINGISLNDLEKFRADFEDLFDRIWNGRMTIDTFVVTGKVLTNKINGISLSDILFARSDLRNIVVDDGLYVKNLIVHGSVNGLNFTRYVSDSVLRTEDRIVVAGEKYFNNLNCRVLRVGFVNGNPVANILHSGYHQTLSGPVIVRGDVTVTNSFVADGKINDVVYSELRERFWITDGELIELRGDFEIPEKVRIKNLTITGSVQGVDFSGFLADVVFRNDDIYISGSKVFRNSVTFKENLTIVNEYNSVDLTDFNQKAVRVDNDIFIDCMVVFKDDLTLAGDLTVLDKLYARSVAQVNIEELKSTAIFLNRSSYVEGTLTFANAIFESDIRVDYLNDVDLRDVISLKEDGTISKPLTFVNVAIHVLNLTGTVNGHRLDQIFDNTFTLSTNQTITGNLIFHGTVRIESDFNPRSLNDVDSSRMIPLDSEVLTGNLRFTRTLKLSENLRLFGTVNGVDLVTWESEAVYREFPQKQSVSGDWIIQGNVTFEKDVGGGAFLNDINVQRLADELEKRNFMMNSIVTNLKMDLESTCQDLRPLQAFAKNQVYRFKFFEYFQGLEFDLPIKSARHVETENDEFLLINLDQCYLNIFNYNGSGMILLSSVQNFDEVEKWITLKYMERVYLLTMGSGNCGRSIGNLWKFEGTTLTPILDLGNVVDAKKIDDHTFLVISAEDKLEKWSIGARESLNTYFKTNKLMRFIPDTESILIHDGNYVHEIDPRYLNHTTSINRFGNGVIFGFRAGIFRKEMFLYYDREVSEDNAFILDGLRDRKIRQSIPTHNPNSFYVLNFYGFIETFVTFVKNGRSLEIFEYKGIEGFVYRESIKMPIDKTFGFKIKKRYGLMKTNFVGAIHRNTLNILEAKMYGEKLDVDHLICEN